MLKGLLYHCPSSSDEVNPPLQLGQLVLLKVGSGSASIPRHFPPLYFSHHGALLLVVLLEVTFTFCRSCRAFEPKWRRYSEELLGMKYAGASGGFRPLIPSIGKVHSRCDTCQG